MPHTTPPDPQSLLSQFLLFGWRHSWRTCKELKVHDAWHQMDPYHYPIILSVCSSRWFWQLFSTYSEYSFLTQHPHSCKSAWHLFALRGARTWSEFSYHPIHTNTRLLKPQTSWIRHLSCTTSGPFRHTYLLFQPPNQLHMEAFCQHLLPPILGLICFHCGLGLCRHPSVSS